MKKSVLLLAVTSVAFSASWSFDSNGLSGWPGLTSSDVHETGLLRAGLSFEYLNTDNGSILTLPMKASWGIAEDFEVGAVIPVVPMDNAYEGSVIGDITLSGGWLYETTRGGTALKFTGRLSLPTGEQYRDRGAEIAFGGASTTTFLDFRLSMSAQYGINGDRNPFSDNITDAMYFSAGGSSFVTSDVLLYAAMNGSTSSEFRVGTGLQYLINEDLAIDGGVTAGLNDYENFGIYTGVSWTGEGY